MPKVAARREASMAGVIIELDVGTPWPGPDERRHRVPRAISAAVVVFGLLVALTGPRLLLPASLTLAWRVTSAAGFFWLGPDAVYTVDPLRAHPAGLRLVARDLRSGAVRWSAELTGPLTEIYASERGSLASRFPPTFSFGARTFLINTDTGRVTRAYPVPAMPVAYVADEVVVFVDWDPSVGPDPSPEEPHATAVGLEWTHRAVGRDLRTGAVRWIRALPAGMRWALPGVQSGAEGIVGLPAGQPWMVTRAAGGAVEVWDLRTGAVAARREYGRMGPESYVAALGGAVFVRLAPESGAGGGSAEILDPWTLAARSIFAPPDLEAEPLACGPVLCMEVRRSVWVVDPASGAILWRTHGMPLRPALEPGGRLATAAGEPVTLFDARTGMATHALGQWRMVDTSAYRSTAMIALANGSGGAELAVLNLDAGTLRRLGSITPWSPGSRCLGGRDRVVCEHDGVVRVWRVG
jgi:hypothetical protein